MSQRRRRRRGNKPHQRCTGCKRYSPEPDEPGMGRCMAFWPLRVTYVGHYSTAAGLGCGRYLKAPERRRR